MKSWNARALVCAIALLAAGGCASRPASAPAHDSRRSFHQLAIGLCEDYPEESRSLAAARRDLALLRSNDLRVLRIAFGWDAMEPEPGKYDWSFWDDFVRLADDYGIRLIPYVCYTPRWASRGEGSDYWRQPPRDNARFAAFVKQLVSRYKDTIHSWEIWNEPDNPAYWTGSVAEFAGVLKAGSDAVRAADPRAEVVLGGLAWNLEFLEALLANPAARQSVDIINLHNYYETWSSDPLERLAETVGRAWDLIQQYQPNLRLWTAEIGYSDFRRDAFVSGQYRAYFRGEHTAEHQASSLFRALTLLLTTEKVSLAAWYRIHDLPEGQEVIGDSNNRHLGVVDLAGNPKPALHALRFFNTLFAAGYACLDATVRVEKEIGSPAVAHVFATRDGSIVVVAWLKTNVPGTRAAPLSGDIADTRESTVRLVFPFIPPGRASAFDAAGRRGAATFVCDPANARSGSIHLSGDGTAVLIWRARR